MTGLHARARRTGDHGSVPDFVPGGEFTVGVEEELMLVDAAGELLGAAAGSLVARACDAGSSAGVVIGEVYVDQVELNSPGVPVRRGGPRVAAAAALGRLGRRGARSWRSACTRRPRSARR